MDTLPDPDPGDHQQTRQLTDGLAAQQARRWDEAARLYEGVLTREPRHPDALHLLGLVCAETGDQERAVSLIEAALREQPDSPVFQFNFARLLQAMDRLREAIGHYDKALALHPTGAEAWFNRANCLMKMAHWQDSLISFENAISIRPDYAAAILNRGITLQKVGRLEEARMAFEKALSLRPAHAPTLSNLGNLLRIQGRWDEARLHCERAVVLDPRHADAHGNLGNVLQNLNDHEGALRSYNKALEIEPTHVNANWNRSLTLLRTGNYRQGWRAYEWRKRLAFTPVAVRALSQPAWTGEIDPQGKTVFLYWEQGLGDTLQFCRYARLLAHRGAKVVLSVPDPLVRIVRTIGPEIEVISAHAIPSRFDLHCALMSLPLAMGTTLSTVPGDVPYLHPDISQLAAWRQRLNGLPGLKVGLVWAGAARPDDPEANAIDGRRSIPLARFAPLAGVPRVCFISLQKGTAASQAAEPSSGIALQDWTNELRDFHDTAALVAALDLVISVDTSCAHLAGAIGRPVWILNRFDHCWRWLSGHGSSPWYPTARLYRQPDPGDWGTMIENVRMDLARLTVSAG